MGFRTISLIVVFASLFFSSTVFSLQDTYFRSLRYDENVPEHCRQTRLSHFDLNELDFFTLSINGAEDHGFTYEYPMQRVSARFLWDVFRDDLHRNPKIIQKIKNNNELSRDYELMMDHHEDKDFGFQVEGEVLEILAILFLEQDLDLYDYFVTGSVSYHGERTHRSIGELDLMIGSSETCQIFAVGEAKLGLGSLSKAQGQLQRFKNFLERMDEFSIYSKVVYFAGQVRFLE